MILTYLNYIDIICLKNILNICHSQQNHNICINKHMCELKYNRHLYDNDIYVYSFKQTFHLTSIIRRKANALKYRPTLDSRANNPTLPTPHFTNTIYTHHYIGNLYNPPKPHFKK